MSRGLVPGTPLFGRRLQLADHALFGAVVGALSPGLRTQRGYHFPMEPLTIGVLAVQGNFREHAQMLQRLGARTVEVRKPEQLDGLDGLVIPGGESTTFMRLMRLYGLDEALRRIRRGRSSAPARG